jgi:hypothetical protein
MLALTVTLAFALLQPTDSATLFDLSTGGGPLEPRFHVTLAPTGQLTVVKAEPPLTEKGLARSSTKVALSPAHTKRLHALAREATDFSRGCNRAADGTNAVLLVSASKGEVRRTCEGAARWPVGPATVRLFGELNAHLKPAFHVY